MPFYEQWEFWFALINLVGIIIIYITNQLNHHKIVNNDLWHLADAVKKIDIKVGEIDKKLDKHETKIAVLEEKTKNS